MRAQIRRLVQEKFEKQNIRATLTITLVLMCVTGLLPFRLVEAEAFFSHIFCSQIIPVGFALPCRTEISDSAENLALIGRQSRTTEQLKNEYLNEIIRRIFENTIYRGALIPRGAAEEGSAKILFAN